MRWQPDHPVRRVAFTIIELMVVVAVIAMLAGILLPSVARARQAAAGTACLSNLRQFAAAAHAYAQCHGDLYPIAQYATSEAARRVHYKWDFITTLDRATRTRSVRPGLLWMGRINTEVHQCPSFKGDAQSPEDPWTGYNYNTSYIGHGQGEAVEAPVRAARVRRPAECALFGDGEFADGANKYMRSPWKDLQGGGDDLDQRTAGTQGYRHAGRTNVAFCDGHAEPWRLCHTRNDEGRPPAPGTGFLSADNRLYDPLARPHHPAASCLDEP